MRNALALSLLIPLMACDLVSPDDDADGLSNWKEGQLGTDPADADSDDDGVVDGDEVELGTDPLAVDSDGDGFADGEELDRGTDPTDMQSAYLGGWPVLDAETKAAVAAQVAEPFEDVVVGEPIPNFVYVDQFGDEVELYDLVGDGRPVLLIVQWGDGVGIANAVMGHVTFEPPNDALPIAGVLEALKQEELGLVLRYEVAHGATERDRSDFDLFTAGLEEAEAPLQVFSSDGLPYSGPMLFGQQQSRAIVVGSDLMVVGSTSDGPTDTLGWMMDLQGAWDLAR